MQVEIREQEPRKAVCMSHHGPYYKIGSTCMALGGWLKENSVTGTGPFVCLYYDNPQTTPEDQLRSDAGIIVANGFNTDDPRVHISQVPGGLYAVALHIGPYDKIPAAWAELMATWLPASGYQAAEGLGVELYISDAADVGPEQAQTELCVPVARASRA